MQLTSSLFPVLFYAYYFLQCLQTLFTAHSVGENGRVLLTDGDSEVLDIARQNISDNDLSDVGKASLLKWDDTVAANRILNEYSDDDKARRGFDIIIGSDCLYSGMKAVKLLFATVASMLAADTLTEVYDISKDNKSKSSIGAEDCHSSDEVEVNSCSSSDEMGQTSIDGGGWMTLNSEVMTDVKPVFILGYERRLGGADVDMDAMFTIAADLGLEWCIAEDSVVDIFGNETSEQTLFWEQCVLLFTRRERPNKT